MWKRIVRSVEKYLLKITKSQLSSGQKGFIVLDHVSMKAYEFPHYGGLVSSAEKHLLENKGQMVSSNIVLKGVRGKLFLKKQTRGTGRERRIHTGEEE